MSAIVHPTPAPASAPGQPPSRHPAAEEKKGFSWKAGVLLLLVAIGGATAYQLWLKPRQRPATAVSTTVRTARVVTGSLVRTVRVAGQTSARSFALLTVPIFRGGRGELTLMKLAAPGSMVKKGDLVAQMDAQNARDRLDDMDDAAEQAQADLRKRKAEQEVDKGNVAQNLRIAKSDLDKAGLENGVSEVKTEIERQLLKLNLDEADARYKQLLKDLPNSEESDRAELAILDITRRRQAIQRDRLANDMLKFALKTPIDGLVVMQQVNRGGEMGQIQQGDSVSPGQPLMKVVDPNTMQIEGTVNQAESGYFRLGQTAVAGLDAFPDLRFKARIYSLGALAVRSGRENYYVRSVPLRVAIEGRDPRLIPDLSAWADVEIARQDNALLVPREAIHTEAGSRMVYVKTAQGFRKRAVETGLETATRVAVVSGLRAGEEVALEVPKTGKP